MPSRIGSKLRYLREQRGLTQHQLAEQLTRYRDANGKEAAIHTAAGGEPLLVPPNSKNQAFSQPHLNNVELGRRDPSLEMVLAVSMALDVRLDYLLRDEIPVESVAAHVGAGHQGQPLDLGHFARRLSQLREVRALTQRELSVSLGLQRQGYLSNLERGRKNPSLSTVLAAADFFGVTCDQLFQEPDS